jgi:arginine-tRNA-protein transferase
MSDQELLNQKVTTPQADYDTLRFVSPEVPCPYLPHRLARNEVFQVDGITGRQYEQLMARGFRRSGRVVYRPRCRSCRACRPLRVPVQSFQETASMRRVRRKNHDATVEVQPPVPTMEKFLLFRRYLEERHDGTMQRGLDSFAEFLYDSPIETLEFCYRLDDRLVGVSIADQCADGLSSVYMYSDPDFAARSLGTFSVLWEIDWCMRKGLAYYYFGYFVAESRTMAYKARFRPNEVLADEGHWVAFRDS